MVLKQFDISEILRSFIYKEMQIKISCIRSIQFNNTFDDV